MRQFAFFKRQMAKGGRRYELLPLEAWKHEMEAWDRVVRCGKERALREGQRHQQRFDPFDRVKAVNNPLAKFSYNRCQHGYAMARESYVDGWAKMVVGNLADMEEVCHVPEVVRRVVPRGGCRSAPPLPLQTPPLWFTPSIQIPNPRSISPKREFSEVCEKFPQIWNFWNICPHLCVAKILRILKGNSDMPQKKKEKKPKNAPPPLIPESDALAMVYGKERKNADGASI